MNKNEKMSFLKGKGAAIGIVVCFMAVLAVVGTYTVGNYKKDMKEQMAKAEKEAEQFTEDNTKETTTDEILLPEVVRMAIQNFSKNPVISTVSGLAG